MMSELLKIDPKKSNYLEQHPSKTLKLSTDISADILQNLFNNMLSTANFPDKMKLGNITPVFKKKRPFKKGKLDQAKANRRLRGKIFVHMLMWLQKKLIDSKRC